MSPLNIILIRDYEKVMRKRTAIVFGLLIMSSVVFGQSQAHQSHISLKIEELFSAASNDDYELARGLILLEKRTNEEISYQFPDSENKTDLNKIKRYCKTLAALNKISDEHLIENFKEVNYKGQDLIIAVILFKSGKQSIRKNLSYLNLEKEYYLVKID